MLFLQKSQKSLDLSILTPPQLFISRLGIACYIHSYDL